MTESIQREADPIVENLRHQLRQWAKHLTRREMYEVLRYERRWHSRPSPVGVERRCA